MGRRKGDWVCKYCHRVNHELNKVCSKCGMKKSQKKRRVDITAYRKRMGGYEEGSTLKEYRDIDRDRRGDWG